MVRFTSIMLLIFSSCMIKSQDLEQMVRPIQMEHSGSIQAGMNYYLNSRTQGSPMVGWSVAGRYNMQINKIALPFSFSFREVGGQFNHPFNYYGASPYYKWIKLHLGQRNLHYSPYTLAGKTINGLGIELTPGHWQLSAIYGSILNYRVNEFNIDDQFIIDLTKRKAIGLKIGYGTAKNFLNLSAFRGFDKSLGEDSEEKYLKDNLVVGATSQVTLFKKLSLNFNGAVSGFTENRSSSAIVIDANWDAAEALFDINASTRLNFAGDLSLNWRSRKWNIGAKYRRIDPLFSSLGTSFFQNDVENITADFGARIFKGKVSISSSVGLEKNNLRNTRAAEDTRLILSMNFQAKPSSAISFFGNYSNYQRSSESQIIDFEDTLRFVSLSQNALLASRINLVDQELWRHQLSVSSHWHRINDQSPIRNLGSDITNYNISAKYSMTSKLYGLNIVPGVRYAKFIFSDRQRERYGITLRITKAFSDQKFYASLMGAWNYSDINGLRDGSILRLNSGLRWRIWTRAYLTARISLIQRELVLSTSYQHLRGSLNFSTSF